MDARKVDSVPADARRAQRVPRFETIKRHSSSPQSQRRCDRPRCAKLVANAGTATMSTTAEHVVHCAIPDAVANESRPVVVEINVCRFSQRQCHIVHDSYTSNMGEMSSIS